MRGAAPTFIGFGGWAIYAEQMGSTASLARQGIAEQCPEREHHDLMSGPHEDVEKENARLRKEVRLLREEREVLKKAAIH
jgi:transposase